MVCLCGMVIEDILHKNLKNGRQFHIDTWRTVCIPKLTKKAMSYPTFERVIASQERHALDILRRRFLGNSQPQELTEHEKLADRDFYRFLAAEGILRPLDKDANEFEITSPFMRAPQNIQDRTGFRVPSSF